MDILTFFLTFYLNHLSPLQGYFLIHNRIVFIQFIVLSVTLTTCSLFRWFKFTLKPPISIGHGKFRLAIWNTSFWNFLVKFGHNRP